MEQRNNESLKLSKAEVVKLMKTRQAGQFQWVSLAMLSCDISHNVIIFVAIYFYSLKKFWQSHGNVNYRRWARATTRYQVRKMFVIEIFVHWYVHVHMLYSVRVHNICPWLQVRPIRFMEPYLLIRKSESPYYSHMLTHRFCNKISYSDILAHQKYEYSCEWWTPYVRVHVHVHYSIHVFF